MTELTTTVSGATAYIVTPDIYDSGASLPVVMAIHGSGQSATSYKAPGDGGIDFYQKQRDLALEAGYIFCVISNGTDTWGTNAGLQRLIDLYNYIGANYITETKWVLWATSAGGSLMHRMIKDHPDKVDRCLGTFPVYSLVDMVDVTANTTAISVWGSGDSVRSSGAEASEWTPDLIGVKYLIYHGQDDVTVPPSSHSSALKTSVNALGGSVAVRIVTGGHSITNWAVYDDVEIAEFLSPTIEVLPTNGIFYFVNSEKLGSGRIATKYDGSTGYTYGKNGTVVQISNPSTVRSYGVLV